MTDEERAAVLMRLLALERRVSYLQKQNLSFAELIAEMIDRLERLEAREHD